MASGFVFIAILFTISTYYEVSGNNLLNLLRLSQQMEDEGLLPGGESSEQAALESVLDKKPVVIVLGDQLLKHLQPHQHAKSALSRGDDLLAKLLGHQNVQKKKAAAGRLHSHRGVQISQSQRKPLHINRARNVLRSPVLQSLLRISNDVQCRAQQRCEMRCNDKYVGKKRDECEDICEEKYECPEIDVTKENSQIQDEEDPCELGDDCGNDSCGTDCPISTKGYTLEPDSRNKCPRC